MSRDDDDVDEAKAMLTKRKRPKKLDPKRLLSSGSTLINLAATGHPDGCYVKSCYHLFVGDSQSGKTWLCLQALAEAAKSKRFKKYRMIYDASENGALMDMRFYFGDGVADRLEAPAYDADEQPMYSETVEQMYDNLRDAIDDGQPFIYVLDSMDMLGTEASDDKELAQMNQRRKGKTVEGSYGDGKAKINSTRLRRVVSKLQRNDSLLIIIAQTRDKLGAMMPGAGKTRSGGHALTFYATTELWTAKEKPIKKTVRGKLRPVGINIKVRLKKNRTEGKDRTVVIPILHGYGVDDVGSCIDYLIVEKHWSKGKSGIKASEFDFVGSKDDLIEYIESNNCEPELRQIVADVWMDIEDQSAPKRKSRYAGETS